MKNIKRILAIIFVSVFVFAACVLAKADFGDYAGDNDYGGYDSYDSYDSYDYDYGSDDDRDSDDYYYYGGIYGDSDSSSGSPDISDYIITFAIVAVLFIVILLKGKLSPSSSKSGKSVPRGAEGVNVSTLRPINSYLELDPGFSESKFKEKISNLYIRFQNSWTAKDMTSIRPYLSDPFFAQCDRQLDFYRSNKRTNRIDRISVLGVELMGWTHESDTDVVYATVRTRIVDYITDDETGNIIGGSSTAEKFMTYQWKLVRSKGRTTQASDGLTVQNCPNCGAPVNINSTAVCEYCGSVLTTDSFDWVVSEIKGIAQRTEGK